MEKRALTDTEKIMLMKLLVGGAAAGGAAGLLTSYGNQIKTLKDRADEAVEDPYIEIPKPPVPGVKMAASDSPHVDRPPGLTALSLALPALGIPAIFTYAAARKAWQNSKKKELEKDLENSQEAYLDAITKGAAAKTPQEKLMDPEGRSILSPEAWGMLAGGVIPLSTLAAAFMTNKVLDKSFPKAKQKPRRMLRIRRQAEQLPGDVHDSEAAEEDGYEKEAAYYELDDTDAVEFLVRTVLGNPKIAAESQLPKLLLRGSEDYNRTSNTFMFRGVDEGFNHVKSASGSWADELDRAAGIHLMVKSAAMGPTVALLAAAEFANAHPALCDQARQIDPRVGEELEKFAALNGAISRLVDVQEGAGEEDFQKAASDVREDIPLARLSQLCYEKRGGFQEKEASAGKRVLNALLMGGAGALAYPTAHFGLSSAFAPSMLPKTPDSMGPYMGEKAVRGGLLGAILGAMHPVKEEEKEGDQEKSAKAEVPTHDAINISESRSSAVAKTENEQGDDPIPEATDDGDIVDQAMSQLAGATS